MKIVLALLMLTGVTLSSWAQEKEKPREWTQIVSSSMCGSTNGYSDLNASATALKVGGSWET